MVEELAADDADAHGLAGSGGAGDTRWRRVLMPDDVAQQGPETTLQVAIIAALVGEIEGKRVERERRQALVIELAGIGEEAV